LIVLRPAQLIDLWGPPTPASIAGSLASTDEAPFALISTDSRQNLTGALFVPLVGERFDGHAYLPAALAAGARGAVYEPGRCPAPLMQQLEAAAAAGALLWPVASTQAAYQQLAGLWRQALPAAVVAVTGSAGKTTTRELIRAVLAQQGPVLASSANENNDVGVPLTLLKATADHRALVVEMGMRGLGEIGRLSHCAEPDIAVITNIGTAHIGRLGSREAIATAKCEIVAALRSDGMVVIPAGDPLLEAALARGWQGRVCRVALADDPVPATGDPATGLELPPADLVGELDGDAGLLHVEGTSLVMPLEGRHNARNLLLALAVGRELGLPIADLAPLAVDLPGGRSRRVRIGAITVLDETYNASPEAVLAALELLARQKGRRFAVLGTMLELGDQSLALHRQVAERAQQLGLDGLVVVDAGPEGEVMARAAAGLPRLARVDTPEQAAEVVRGWLTAGDQLLLKASRGVALERLLPLLEADLATA
jgi:UDP-N-acetylmuramoyl-tripeptide--D-alanyl-D-alanine ligase